MVGCHIGLYSRSLQILILIATLYTSYMMPEFRKVDCCVYIWYMHLRICIYISTRNINECKCMWKMLIWKLYFEYSAAYNVDYFIHQCCCMNPCPNFEVINFPSHIGWSIRIGSVYTTCVLELVNKIKLHYT